VLENWRHNLRSKQVVIFPSNEIEEVPRDMLSELHQRELETIKIALQLSADYVFIEDFDACQVAEAKLKFALSAHIISQRTNTLNRYFYPVTSMHSANSAWRSRCYNIAGH